jgi:hypothetical protein
VLAAPAVAVGVLVLTFLLALPLALLLRGEIEAQLGDSLVADGLADGIDYTWWEEYLAEATPLGSTFSPAIIGFAATLTNLGEVADGRAPAAPVAGVIILYLAGWAFLAGGILDRYARQRPTRAHGFFAACGVFFFRFLRLAIVAGAVYGWLFTYVHPWLFDDLYVDLTRDLDVERTAFFWRVGLYAVFGTLLVAANVVFDYTKVRLVVEDRHSVVGALFAALRFVRRHLLRVAGLYALNTVVFLAVLAVWALAAPGVTGTGTAMWLAFAGAQAYIVVRLLLKLQFLASQTALFQASLAHASYTRAPAPAWPESPAAETIGA